MERITQTETVRELDARNGYAPSFAWISPPGEKHSVKVSPELIHALCGVTVTLYADLKGEGEDALAADILDQHRRGKAYAFERYGGKKG